MSSLAHTGLVAPIAPSRRMKGIMAASGAFLGMATGFGTLVLGAVFMGALEAEFGWSRTEVSAGYAVTTVGMAVGGLFWGRISDRMDLRMLLAFGGASMALPLAGFAAMTMLWQYYMMCFLIGLCGFGCLYAPLLSASGEWFPARRGLVVGIVTAGGAVGQGALPYAADSMIAMADWRAAYWTLAVFVALVQLVVLLTVRRAPELARTTRAAGNPANGFRFFANRRLTGLAAAAFLCCACMGMPLIHLAGYVGSICASPSLGATSLLVAMVSGAVGRVVFGAVADRLGNIATYMVASAIQTACLVAFPWLESQATLIALSAIFGFGFAGNMTCLLLCIRDEVPASAFGAAIGPVMFIAWAGMGIGGIMGGAMYDALGAYDLAFYSAAFFGLGNLFVLAALAAGMGPFRAAGTQGDRPGPVPVPANA